jgi:hypothetical protein
LPPATPQGKINTTDLDSRNVKTPRGWVQGYNAQAATTEGQIVVAAELTNSPADFGQLGPLVDAARDELVAAGIEDRPDVVLADAGYWHQVQIQALAAEGITVLIPPDANKRQRTRAGWNGGLYAFMRRALATAAGAALYRRRSGMIEPVFADTKFNRKIDRFLRRGRAACRSEWRLITATHSLRKLHQHRLAHRLTRPPGRAAAQPARFPSTAGTRAHTPRLLCNSHHARRQPWLPPVTSGDSAQLALVALAAALPEQQHDGVTAVRHFGGEGLRSCNASDRPASARIAAFGAVS